MLINDGTGNYPARIELARPTFNDGYTSVSGQTHFDVNGDGFQDLLVVHTRNDDGPPDVIPFTGRYVQVLINRGTPSRVLLRRGPMSFGDETVTWMGDQSATTPEFDQDGEHLSNDAEPKMYDVDRDGCADLVMSRNQQEVQPEAPLVYRNNGSGQFGAMPPEPFAGSDRYFGLYAVPADVNGDAVIDFVVPRRHDGPDGRPRTADDFGTLVTLVNTTPAGPRALRVRSRAASPLTRERPETEEKVRSRMHVICPPNHPGPARGLLAAACLLPVACNGNGGGPTGPTPTSPGATSSVSVTYPADHGTIYVGDQVQFEVSVSSSGGGTQAAAGAVWTSNAPAVAMVSPSGLVTAVSAGEATISLPKCLRARAARCAFGSFRGSTGVGKATST